MRKRVVYGGFLLGVCLVGLGCLLGELPLPVALAAPLAGAQAPSPKSAEPLGEQKRLPPLDIPRIVPAELPAQCQQARERALALLAELEAGLSPQAKAAAERYAAKPEPGVDAVKAWGDYAAAASLMGDAPVAAWAGLKAVEIRWGGDTVTNAGIYLYHLGKTQEALELLNCAYAMGYRSPYLFEALAVIHQSQGNNAQARQAINQAQQAAPDDAIIETEASFINTGQPPPPRPPQRDPDGLDSAILELEEHAQRALNLIQAQAHEMDASMPDANARRYQQDSADFFAGLVQGARDEARQARAADPSSRQIVINAALSGCVSSYALITDHLLSFPGTTAINGSGLLFFADVLGLDSAALHREQEGGWKEAMRWAGHSTSPPLAQPATTEYRRDWDAGDYDHTERVRACRDDPCVVREDARWCGVWKQLYEAWADKSRQRYNAAARRFDRVATRRVIEAENEYLQLRDYAVRQLKKMRFPPASATGGFSMEQMTLQGINGTIQPVYNRHLNDPDAGFGTIQYVRERALWFEAERSYMEEILAVEAKTLQRECEPAMQALLELLAQEEWQAYVDHLKDRLAWDVQGQTESEFPCEGAIGPLTVSTDVNELGSGKGKFDLKWKPKLYERGGGKVSGSAGVSIGVGGQGSEVSLGGSAGYGPFQGKAKVTLTNKVNPYNSQEYMGIKLKGSAGLGLKNKSGTMGVACYPSSGSVTFYPRALYEDAVRYLSAPSSPPRGGGRPR